MIHVQFGAGAQAGNVIPGAKCYGESNKPRGLTTAAGWVSGTFWYPCTKPPPTVPVIAPIVAPPGWIPGDGSGWFDAKGLAVDAGWSRRVAGLAGVFDWVDDAVGAVGDVVHAVGDAVGGAVGGVVGVIVNAAGAVVGGIVHVVDAAGDVIGDVALYTWDKIKEWAEDIWEAFQVVLAKLVQICAEWDKYTGDGKAEAAALVVNLVPAYGQAASGAIKTADEVMDTLCFWANAVDTAIKAGKAIYALVQGGPPQLDAFEGLPDGTPGSGPDVSTSFPPPGWVTTNCPAGKAHRDPLPPDLNAAKRKTQLVAGTPAWQAYYCMPGLIREGCPAGQVRTTLPGSQCYTPKSWAAMVAALPGAYVAGRGLNPYYGGYAVYDPTLHKYHIIKPT